MLFALLLAGALLSFATWCVALLFSVARLREEVETRVGWLRVLQRAQTVVAKRDRAAALDARAALEQLSRDAAERGAFDDDAEIAAQIVRESLEQLSTSTAADVQRAADGLDVLTARVRAQTGERSAELGNKWNDFTLLVLCALFLSACCAYFILEAGARAAALKRSERRTRKLAAEREQLAEQDRERQRRDFRKVLDGLGEGVVIVREGRILYCNPAFQSIVRRQESLVGLDLLDVLSPPNREETRKLLSSSQQGELTFQAPSGDRATLDFSYGQPVEFEGTGAIVLVTRDVTQRRRMSAELRLQDRMASIGTLAAGIGHQINNPLSYVMSNLEFLAAHLKSLKQGDPTLERDFEDSISEALEGSQRVKEIVRDLAAFTPPQQERIAPVDLRAVIDEAMRMLTLRLDHQPDVSLSCGPLPRVLANEARLAKALFSVLLNGVQASNAAGRSGVAITAQTDERGWAVIEIKDRGRGIPRETQDLIFDPFYTAKATKSLGLGLFVSHHVVTQLGGRLFFETREEEGTRFWIEMPPAPRAGTIPPNGAKKLRVLIADDDTSVALSLTKILSGHDISIATHAEDAIRRVAESDLDVAFCDLPLPGMSAGELYERLARARPSFERRVIFMVGAASIRDRQFLSELKNPVLEKPVEAPAVNAALAAIGEISGEAPLPGALPGS